MRKIILYTYYIDEQRLETNNNLMLERNIVNLESRSEHELIFAVGTRLGRNIRVGIASKPGKVYHNSNNNTYNVWFDAVDRDAAIEAIGNYILDNVSREIRTHKSFIRRLESEQLNAIKLLEGLE